MKESIALAPLSGSCSSLLHSQQGLVPRCFLTPGQELWKRHIPLLLPASSKPVQDPVQEGSFREGMGNAI